MHPGVRARQLIQWVLSAVLVVGILVVAWYSSSKNRPGGDDPWLDGGDGPEPRVARRRRILRAVSPGDLVDARLRGPGKSLQRLDGARDALLKKRRPGVPKRRFRPWATINRPSRRSERAWNGCGAA